MIVYNYNASTKLYTYSEEAKESPLEIGVYLIPANSTTIKPPTTTGVEKARFIDGAWVIVEDNRGLWYNVREPVNITEFGPVPEGYTKEPAPLTQEELDQIAALEARLAAIEAEQEASAIHKYTPEQVKNYIDNQFALATTVAQIKAVVQEILKKMAVYILK